MIEDNLVQYQLRKIDGELKKRLDALTSCIPEDLRFIQGEFHAYNDMRIVLQEQYQNWLRGEDNEESGEPTELEKLLALAPSEP